MQTKKENEAETNGKLPGERYQLQLETEVDQLVSDIVTTRQSVGTALPDHPNRIGRARAQCNVLTSARRFLWEPALKK